MKIVATFLTSVVAGLAVVGVTVVGCTNNFDTGRGTSALGESCTRTFDCKGGLDCVGGVCVSSSTTADAAPHLGLLNETCSVTADCTPPLACVSGSCQVTNYGITVTGNTCGGECKTAADCCELPTSQQFTPYPWYLDPPTDSMVGGGYSGYSYYVPTIYGVRCEDLTAYFGSTGAAACSNTSLFTGSDNATLSQACFLYQTYCQCGANTWACTQNQCVYGASCIGGAHANELNGCPTNSRAGSLGSGTCPAAAGQAGNCSSGCTTDSDCDGKSAVGASRACGQADAGNQDCTCYQSACYLKCSKDLDCAAGYTCDMASNTCVEAGCTSDAQCVKATGKPLSVCKNGTCETSCKVDADCNSSGSISSVCNNGVCEDIGCSADSDCKGSSMTPQMFCIPATAAMMSVHTSAITN